MLTKPAPSDMPFPPNSRHISKFGPRARHLAEGWAPFHSLLTARDTPATITRRTATRRAPAAHMMRSANAA